jgi:transcription antitermination protein NusB
LLLKIALAELIEFPNIPIKVTLNEYIELAKVYSTPRSNVFVNGILDKLIVELKESGKIVKTGRGLME